MAQWIAHSDIQNGTIIRERHFFDKNADLDGMGILGLRALGECIDWECKESRLVQVQGWESRRVVYRRFELTDLLCRAGGPSFTMCKDGAYGIVYAARISDAAKEVLRTDYGLFEHNLLAGLGLFLYGWAAKIQIYGDRTAPRKFQFLEL